MKVTDEKGSPWVVSAGDPANQIILSLKRKGFDYIVLPRYTYRSGSYPDVLPECTDYIAKVRMHDCRKTIERL